MKMGSSPVLKCNRATQQPDNNKTRSVHMKLFQKTALAVAIAAVPFLSVNAMEALDDAALSEMTGQAGVTIETQLDGTGITIGSIQYTDTDGIVNDGINDTGGSVFIESVGIAAADGNLVTSTTTSGGQKITVGDVQLRSHTQANANTAGASLVSNLSMTTSQTGASYTSMLNLSDKANNSAIVGDVYTFANSETVNISKATGDIAIVTNSSSQITDLSVEALGGAIGIEGMKYHGGDDGSGGTLDMKSTQVIWANNGTAANGGGVYIQGSDSTGTLEIAKINIGGSNIGAVKISDIVQSGSVTRIYGH